MVWGYVDKERANAIRYRIFFVLVGRDPICEMAQTPVPAKGTAIPRDAG